VKKELTGQFYERDLTTCFLSQQALPMHGKELEERIIMHIYEGISSLLITYGSDKLLHPPA